MADIKVSQLAAVGAPDATIYFYVIQGGTSYKLKIDAAPINLFAAPTASISMGNFKLTSVGTGTLAGDAVNYSQLTGLQSTLQGQINTINTNYPIADSNVISGYQAADATALSNANAAYGIKANNNVWAKTQSAQGVDMGNVSGTQTLDMTLSNYVKMTLTGNLTLANPSAKAIGSSGLFALTQDGTGSRTLSLGSQFKTSSATPIVLTTTAGALDLISWFVIDASRILVTLIRDVR